MNELNLYLTIFTTIFGLLVGSFLNVVIYRIPRNLSVVTPRSQCPECKSLIKWYQNIPVLSYLVQRGKCSNCGTKISVRYPIVELVVGACAFALAPDDLSGPEILTFTFYFSTACVFISHFLIDIEHHLLPDKINIYFLLFTLPYVVLTYPIMHWLLGGLIGFFSTYLITYIFYKVRGQIGLGGGDIKLYGIIGLIVGPIGVMNTIFMSCMFGSIIGIGIIVFKKLDKNTPFAFGPYIILTAVLQIFFPELIPYINPLYIN